MIKKSSHNLWYSRTHMPKNHPLRSKVHISGYNILDIGQLLNMLHPQLRHHARGHEKANKKSHL